MEENVSNLDFIFKRRSVRKFEDRPVEQEKLVQLLEAGMSAPSANNGQPWEFVVVTDPVLLEKVRQVAPYGKYNCAAAIVVCGSVQKSNKPESSKCYWVQDCTAAVENILIAAPALDLGTVWIGTYPREERVKGLQDLLGIPEEVTPLAMVYVGYPAEHPSPRTQYKEERVHWNKY
jgi:nitroreductase